MDPETNQKGTISVNFLLFPFSWCPLKRMRRHVSNMDLEMPEALRGTPAAEGWVRVMEGREGVKRLYMERRGLESWPANLSGDSFPGLEWLIVCFNASLKEMPLGLSPFPCLTVLSVASTGLSTLPRDLARVCPLLEQLNLYRCQFRVIPEGVRGLTRLKA